jgi:hypothetical protein
MPNSEQPPIKFNGKIYFYCDPRQGIPPGEQYQHLLICLAEGLQLLDIKFFANVNYWRNSPEQTDYLFQHDPLITADDCSVVVLTNVWYHAHLALPENLFHPRRQYVTVYLDAEDDDKTYSLRPEFRQFDLILRTHFNGKFNYGQNFHPWAFGLSSRILTELKEIPEFESKKSQIIVNFRHWKTGHPVRNTSCSQLIPQIEKTLAVNNHVDSIAPPPQAGYHYFHWLQTGGRHYPNYYKRLSESVACTCFGGFFVPPWPNDPSNLINRLVKQVGMRLKLKTNRIVQWDSWRFWESLAAGCATFHVDFDKYGISLPVMPENWRHYIGVDLDNIPATVDRIAAQPEILKNISQEGRLWALKYYSPSSTALRFLAQITNHARSSSCKLSHHNL